MQFRCDSKWTATVANRVTSSFCVFSNAVPRPHNSVSLTLTLKVAEYAVLVNYYYYYYSLLRIKDIYIAQVHRGHTCTMSAEMAVWLRNCLCLYSDKTNCQDSLTECVFRCLLKVSSVTSLDRSATGKLFHATGPLTAKLPSL